MCSVDIQLTSTIQFRVKQVVEFEKISSNSRQRNPQFENKYKFKIQSAFDNGKELMSNNLQFMLAYRKHKFSHMRYIKWKSQS